MWRTTFLMCFTVSRWKLTVAKVSQDPKLSGDRSIKHNFFHFFWWHLNGRIVTGPDKTAAASHRLQAFSITEWRNRISEGGFQVAPLRSNREIAADECLWSRTILNLDGHIYIFNKISSETDNCCCQKSTLPSFVSGTEPSWHLKSSRRSCFPSVYPSATGRHFSVIKNAPCLEHVCVMRTKHTDEMRGFVDSPASPLGSLVPPQKAPNGH